MAEILWRRFLVAASLLLAAPVVCAQQVQTSPTSSQSPPLVAWLMFGPPEPPGRSSMISHFREGLRAHGYEDGQTIRIVSRFTYNDASRAPALARELLGLKPAVILTSCADTQRAIRDLNRTVPIIAVCAELKNFLGEVASLNRPGGATTGILLLAPESAGKRLEILKAIRPDLKRVGLLYGEKWGESYFRENERAAAQSGLTLVRLSVAHVDELGKAFAKARMHKVEALVVFFDVVTGPGTSQIVKLAIQHQLPVVSDSPLFVERGGLFSYGADWADLFYRVLPRQLDRILKGVNPGDLPIEQPTKFTLNVNLQTAKAIGLTIPQSVLLRADRVIE